MRAVKHYHLETRLDGNLGRLAIGICDLLQILLACALDLSAVELHLVNGAHGLEAGDGGIGNPAAVVQLNGRNGSMLGNGAGHLRPFLNGLLGQNRVTGRGKAALLHRGIAHSDLRYAALCFFFIIAHHIIRGAAVGVQGAHHIGAGQKPVPERQRAHLQGGKQLWIFHDTTS